MPAAAPKRNASSRRWQRRPPRKHSSAARNRCTRTIDPENRVDALARPKSRGLRGSLPKEPRPQSIHGCGPLSPMGACPLQGARRAPIVCSRPEASSASAELASSCVVVRSRVFEDRRAYSRRSYCPFVTSHRPVRAFVSHEARHHPFACERLDDCLAVLSRTFRSCPTCSPLPDFGLCHLADRRTKTCAPGTAAPPAATEVLPALV